MAEDNALNMEIATTLLSEAGAVITPVSNGEAAVEAFSQNPQGTFDVILMDIMMPVMDGLTAARTIRGMQRADAASIPIIAMTANAFDEDMQASKEAGMDAHLAKPLNIAKVISEISRLVYHARHEAPPPSRCEVDQYKPTASDRPGPSLAVFLLSYSDWQSSGSRNSVSRTWKRGVWIRSVCMKSRT